MTIGENAAFFAWMLSCAIWHTRALLDTPVHQCRAADLVERQSEPDVRVQVARCIGNTIPPIENRRRFFSCA